MEPTLTQHIESDPKRCGGKPCIAGTRIRVWDIYVAREIRGETVDQIAAQYPSITLADVHAALTYFYDNRETIEREMRQADELVRQLRSTAGPGPLAKKLAGKEPTSD